MNWNWTGARHAVALVVSSGCTSALLTYVLTKIDLNRMEQEQRAVRAMDIASRLELFAYECSSLEGEYDTAAPSDRVKLGARLPSLSLPETDSAWLGLPHGDQDKVLLLKLRMTVAQDYIRSAVRFASPADVAQATRDEAVLLGADAWRAARSLRDKHRLASPDFPYPFGSQMLRDAGNLLRYWRNNPAEAGVNPG